MPREPMTVPRAENLARTGALGTAGTELLFELERVRRVVADYERLADALEPLCPCPDAEGGPEQDCPLHGDGRTFVLDHRRLQNIAAAARGVAFVVTPETLRVLDDALDDGVTVAAVDELVRLRAVEVAARAFAALNETPGADRYYALRDALRRTLDGA